METWIPMAIVSSVLVPIWIIAIWMKVVKRDKEINYLRDRLNHVMSTQKQLEASMERITEEMHHQVIQLNHSMGRLEAMIEHNKRI